MNSGAIELPFTTEIRNLELEHGRFSTILHELWEERRSVRNAVSAAIAKAWREERKTLLVQLTFEALTAAGNEFALIDLDGNDSLRRQTRTTHFRIDAEDEISTLVDVDDTSKRAPLDQTHFLSASEYDRGDIAAAREPAWAFWHAIRWSSQMLLPAKLQHRHPAFEMPMKLAKTAILGGFPDLEMLRRIDSESANWRRKTDTVIGTATQLATLGLDMGSIELRHKPIVETMRGHDWTWREADQYLERAAERETTMLRMLSEIAEAEARALWFRHAPSPLSYTRWSATAKQLHGLRMAPASAATA